MKHNVFENEEWRQISGYPNYSVSNTGRIKNNKTEMILRPDGILRENVSLTCKITDGNKYRKFTIAQLVAEAFIPNKKGSKKVVHIDKNRDNNCVENLRWSQEK